MKDEFNSWWHNGEASTNNPYELDSAAYWAWEGWCAAVEACAKYFDEHWREIWTDEQIAEAIRARGGKL